MSELTDEQIAQFPKYAEKFLDKLFKKQVLNSYNEDTLRAKVKELYSFFGYDEPLVYIARTPYDMEVMANIAVDMYESKKKKEQDLIMNTPEKEFQKYLEDNLQARKDKKKKLTFYDISYDVNFTDYGWLLSFDFFKNETDKLEPEFIKELDTLLSIIDAGLFLAVNLEKISIVCLPPDIAERDEEGNFHCLTGPALGFSEQSEFDHYFIHGRNIPKGVFEVALHGELTREAFMGETNEEYRSAWYEILGQEGLMNLLGATEVSRETFVHRGGMDEVVLYKTNDTFPALENQPLAWVKFICPSTGHNYLIDVEPHFTSAKEAAVSTSPFYGEEVKGVEDYDFFSRN